MCIFFCRLCRVSLCSNRTLVLVYKPAKSKCSTTGESLSVVSATADRVSLEGARRNSTSNHWKLFLSSNMLIHKPTGSYFSCWCQNQIWWQEGGKTLKDISQRVLMSSLFPASISAATTSWKISFGLGTPGKCGAGRGSDRGEICG